MLYLKCFIIALPTISWSMLLSTNILLYTQQSVYALFIGLITAIPIYPLAFQRYRRTSLLILSLYDLIVAIVASVLNSQFPLYLAFLGLSGGCNSTASMLYIRETTGWEEPRAIHLNNITSMKYPQNNLLNPNIFL